VLGLELRQEDTALRLYNPATGERLPTSDEVVLARRAAEAALQETQVRLRQEFEAREEAEARIKALEAELSRLRTPDDRRQEPE
jgi:hypothetical protein